MSQDDDAADAIDRLVAGAKQAGAVLRTGESAKRLLADHPQLRITLSEAAQLIARRAMAAGVPLQFTPLK